MVPHILYENMETRPTESVEFSHGNVFSAALTGLCSRRHTERKIDTFTEDITFQTNIFQLWYFVKL